jgi:hypothetical protein
MKLRRSVAVHEAPSFRRTREQSLSDLSLDVNAFHVQVRFHPHLSTIAILVGSPLFMKFRRERRRTKQI